MSYVHVYYLSNDDKKQTDEALEVIDIINP